MIDTALRAVQKAARALGVTVIPNARVKHYPAAVYLEKLFQALRIDCVLDVGANVGRYRDFLRAQVGYRGIIVSFEPIPEHVELLRRRAARDPNWIVEGCALGGVAGEAEFNVMRSTVFSSFLEPDHSEVPAFKGRNEVRERVAVEVRVLDDVLPDLERRLGISRPYLKLDTQGFDLEVVKGAGNCLGRIRALQTEASVKPLYRGMPDFTQAIDTLRSLGFELSAIFPTNPRGFPLLVEFDCYMVSTAGSQEIMRTGAR